MAGTVAIGNSLVCQKIQYLSGGPEFD